MKATIRLSILMTLAIGMLILAFSWRTSAELVFRRQLTPPEQRNIKDAIRKLRTLTDDLTIASQLEKIASFRHESTLIYIAEFLGAQYSEVIRLSAADSIGRIGSPNGVGYLTAMYMDDATSASLKVSSLAGISAISAEALKIEDQSFRRDAEQKMQLLLPLSRSYFLTFGHGDPILMDAVDEWAAILTLLHGDRQAEKLIVELLKSSDLNIEFKCRLSRLFRTVPAFDADSLALVLIQQFKLNTNLRLKNAILEAMGNINRGKALLLNTALTSNYVFLRKTALESLMKYRHDIQMNEMLPLLKETDPEVLIHVYDFIVPRLENGNLQDYCTYGINNANALIAQLSCTVFRIAVNNWKRDKKDEPWIRSVVSVSPVLLELMETEKPLPPVVMREAYMTWLSLFPPGLEPRLDYDWNAPLDRRREMVERLRTESNRTKDGIAEAIRENCDRAFPEPSPTPSGNSKTAEPIPSSTPPQTERPVVPSPSPAPSIHPVESVRPTIPRTPNPTPISSAVPSVIPSPTRTRDPLPPPPKTTPIRIPDSPRPTPSEKPTPSPSRTPEPEPTPEPTHDHHDHPD